MARQAPPATTGGNDPVGGPHNLPSPLSIKQFAERQIGLEKKLSGQIPATAKVAKVAKGQYVQLAFEGEDQIFTFLGQFGPNPGDPQPR